MLRSLAAGLLSAIVATGTAFSQSVSTLSGGQTGRIEFDSRTPSGPSELMSGGGPRTPIVGWLELPPGGAGKRPAMVIAHGSGGILDGREGAWAARLNALGVATFVVDSFTPRGFAATGDDQTRLPLAASVADGLSTLKLLASHPAIDATRIGIMGFSKGGQVALYSALEPFRRAVLDTDLRFALHIALYSSCSVPYRSREVTRAPIFFLLGAADDFTPAAHCLRYADWFRGKGAPVFLTTLADAHHGFDLPTPPRFQSRLQTARDCGLDIELEPVVARRWDDGSEVPASGISNYLRACTRRGATYGGNPTALAQAVQHVNEAVAAHLLSGR